MTTATNGHRPPTAPPSNVEAEQVVLGLAMRDSNALAWLAANLDPLADFWRPAHREIAAVLVELHRDGVAVDQGVLLATLSERGLLPGVGTGAYLLELDELATTPANIGWHGRKVRATARRRQAADLLVELGQAQREGLDADGLAALAVDRFQRLMDGDRSGDNVGGVAELLEALRETRDRRLSGDRVSWGLASLDELTGGLDDGTLVIVAARPAKGKSSLGLQVASTVAESRRTVFVSYEMTRSQLGRRQLALYSHLPADLALMRVDDPQVAAARQAYESIDFTFLDGRPDIDRLVTQLRSLHATRPLGLVVVDYLQLVPVARSVGARTRQEEVAYVTRRLKDLAGRLDCPVLALAQVGRDADGQKPELKDLRESGELEQTADVVVFLHEVPGKATMVIVAKHRDGSEGWRWLRFDKPRTTFSDDPRNLTS